MHSCPYSSTPPVRILEDRGFAAASSERSSAATFGDERRRNANPARQRPAGERVGGVGASAAASKVLIGTTLVFVDPSSSSLQHGDAATAVVATVDLRVLGVLEPQDVPCQSFSWIPSDLSDGGRDAGIGVFVGARGDVVVACFTCSRRPDTGGDAGGSQWTGRSVARIVGRGHLENVGGPPAAARAADSTRGHPSEHSYVAPTQEQYEHAGGEPLSVLVSYSTPPRPTSTEATQPHLLQLQVLWVDAATPTAVSFCELFVLAASWSSTAARSALVSRVLRPAADASAIFTDGVGQRRIHCVRRIHAVHWCSTTMDYTGNLNCFAMTVDGTPTPTDPVVRTFSLAMLVDRETAREAAVRRAAYSKWCGKDDDAVPPPQTMHAQLGEGPWRLEPTTIVCPHLMVHLRVPASVSTGASMAFTTGTTTPASATSASTSFAAAYDDVFGVLQSVPASMINTHADASPSMPTEFALRHLDMLRSGRDAANLQLQPPLHPKHRQQPADDAQRTTQFALYGAKGLVASYKVPGDVVCAALCGGAAMRSGAASSVPMSTEPLPLRQLSLCCLTTTSMECKQPPCSAYILRVCMHEQRSANSLRRPTSAGGASGQADWNTISYLSIACVCVDLMTPLRKALHCACMPADGVGDDERSPPHVQYAFVLRNTNGGDAVESVAPTERIFVGAVSLRPSSAFEGGGGAQGCTFEIAQLTLSAPVDGVDQGDEDSATINAAIVWGDKDDAVRGGCTTAERFDADGNPRLPPPPPRDAWLMACPLVRPLHISPSAAAVDAARSMLLWSRCGVMCVWRPEPLTAGARPTSSPPADEQTYYAAPFNVAMSVWERSSLWRVASEEVDGGGLWFDRLCAVALPGHPPLAVLVDANMKAHLIALSPLDHQGATSSGAIRKKMRRRGFAEILEQSSLVCSAGPASMLPQPPPRLIPTQLAVVAGRDTLPDGDDLLAAAPSTSGTVSGTWWMVLSTTNIAGNATFLLLRGRVGASGGGADAARAESQVEGHSGIIEVVDVFRGFVKCVPVFLLVPGKNPLPSSSLQCDVLFIAESVIRSLTVVVPRSVLDGGGGFARRHSSRSINGSTGGVVAETASGRCDPPLLRELCALTRKAPIDVSPLDGFGNPTVAWRLLSQEYSTASHAFWFLLPGTPPEGCRDGMDVVGRCTDIGCFCCPGGHWVLVDVLDEDGDTIGRCGARRLHVTRVDVAASCPTAPSNALPRRHVSLVRPGGGDGGGASVVQRIVSECGRVHLERRVFHRLKTATAAGWNGRRVAQALQQHAALLGASDTAGHHHHPAVVGTMGDEIDDAGAAADARQHAWCLMPSS